MLKCFKFFFRLCFLNALLLTSCASRSLEDFHEEGEGVIRSIINELQSVQTREQLLASSQQLRYYFLRLVEISINAQKFQASQKSMVESKSFSFEWSDLLRSELNRIYQIEGGKQIIEKAQEPALHKLDAFEKSFYLKTS